MLVRRDGGSWEPPPVRAYADEAELQALIVESPGLVVDGDEPAAAVLRELALPAAGSLDVLVVHLNGDLTLVEAKLNRNAEIRRAVVGQLLGYAGGLWHLGVVATSAERFGGAHGRTVTLEHLIRAVENLTAHLETAERRAEAAEADLLQLQSKIDVTVQVAG